LNIFGILDIFKIQFIIDNVPRTKGGREQLYIMYIIKQSYQIPQIWVKYGFRRFDQIRVSPRVKYGFVKVGGQIENRVKYGFVTIRDLLLVRAIRAVVFKLSSPSQV
jgi:hypothetical protein